MIRKQSADPVFDKVSHRLSDAVKRNMNQKYVFSEKKAIISDGLSMLISLVKFLKIIAPKTEQIPPKYHSVSNFREAPGLVP